MPAAVQDAAQQLFVDKMTKAKSTPLRFAVKNGHISAAKKLIQAKANCREKDGQVPGLFPLYDTCTHH